MLDGHAHGRFSEEVDQPQHEIQERGADDEQLAAYHLPLLPLGRHDGHAHAAQCHQIGQTVQHNHGHILPMDLYLRLQNKGVIV